MTYRELNLPEEVYDKIKERYVELGHVFDIDYNCYRNQAGGGLGETDEEGNYIELPD